MKTVLLVLLLSAAWCAPAQTNEPAHKKHANAGAAEGVGLDQTNQDMCCRYPRRAFGNDAVVNLTPLFKWWSQHAVAGLAGADAAVTDERPLPAWHRITGNHVGDAEYNWVVEAEVHTNPGVRLKERIILKNPPLDEERLFYSLKNGLATADRQMTNDQRLVQEDTKAAQKAAARSRPVNNSRNAKAQANENAQAAIEDQQTIAAALEDQKQLEQAVPVAQKRLRTIPSKNGRYALDCFALEVGKTKAGLPIYDLGAVDLNSP